MNKYTLSILIPARNEEFLARTIKDLLEHKSPETQIIAGLDGQWANPPIEDHPDLTLVYYPEAIGQRAMTNQLCKISTAKYVMKVDAHCSFEQGFDLKMIEAMEKEGDNVTMVPIMRNLHAFDWVCPDGHRRYQGPSGPCLEKDCGKPTTKDVVWIAKPSPQSKSYCFDAEPHFQYFGEHCKTPKFKKELEETGLTETMSLQGSCFMCTREKYWELGLSDEEFGSWGSQGIEVACKTWLSGGRVLVNHKTYYAHMFRTQGGDFSFPYPQSGRSVQKAKKFAKDLFFTNSWNKQVRPLSWLAEKFWPLKGWVDKDLQEIKKYDWFITGAPTPVAQNTPVPTITNIPTRSIIYYTDNALNLKIAHLVQNQLRSIGLPIFSSSLKPMSKMGTNVFLPLKRGVLTYFRQVVAALEASNTDIVYFCEHDVIYDKSHFEFIPPRKDKFYYNLNVWRWKFPTDWFVSWEAEQVAEMCCYRDLALGWYRNKLKEVESGIFDRSYEPGAGNKDLYENWKSTVPNIDIRHGGNLTKSKWSINDFRDKSSCINWKEGTMDTIPGLNITQLKSLM